jgi:hypothetical protein
MSLGVMGPRNTGLPLMMGLAEPGQEVIGPRFDAWSGARLVADLHGSIRELRRAVPAAQL